MAVTYAELRAWVLALPGTREVFVDSWNHFTLRVQVTLANADPAELRRLVEDAWRATAPKKVVQRYDSAQG